MKLAIVNGSPRGKNSNSTLITTWMFAQQTQLKYDTYFAADIKAQRDTVAQLAEYDTYLIIFPLYTDAMPGLVKEFFEHMEERKNSFAGKDVYFIIHSGFPEAKHSRPVERYVQHFARLMGMHCVSTAVKGGSEGFQAMPERFLKKTMGAFETMGASIAQRQPFDENALKALAKRESLTAFARTMMKVFSMSSMYWTSQLKRYGTYKERKSRPLT